MMDSSHKIRAAMAHVAELRQQSSLSPELAQALGQVKTFQSQRLASTYADFLSSQTYAACTTFFLQELYGSHNYSQRDAQFARIAGALQRTFPDQVVSTAVTLAQLHSLTEELDLAMAKKWCQSRGKTATQRYALAWDSVGTRADRQRQVQTVLQIGQELAEFTKKRGLRLLLKMMRKPAKLAGVAAFQAFLESGFDNFSSIARHQGNIEYFLQTIKTRESAWLAQMYQDAGPGNPAD